MKQYTAERDPATGFGRAVERPGRAGFNEKSRDARRLRRIVAIATPAKGAVGNRAKYA